MIKNTLYLMYPTSFSTSHSKLLPSYFPNVMIGWPRYCFSVGVFVISRHLLLAKETENMEALSYHGRRWAHVSCFRLACLQMKFEVKKCAKVKCWSSFHDRKCRYSILPHKQSLDPSAYCHHMFYTVYTGMLSPPLLPWEGTVACQEANLCPKYR